MSYTPITIACYRCEKTFTHDTYDELSMAMAVGVYHVMRGKPDKYICGGCYDSISEIEDRHQEECKQEILQEIDQYKRENAVVKVVKH